MQNRDIEFNSDFKGDRVILSRATYEEIVAFCRMHGETDLPPFPPDFMFKSVFEGKHDKEVKKLTDE